VFAGGTADGIENSALRVRVFRWGRLLLALGSVPCAFSVRTADGLRFGVGIFLVFCVNRVRLLLRSVPERLLRRALLHAVGAGRCLAHAFAICVF